MSIPGSLHSSKLLCIYPIQLQHQRHPGESSEVKKM